MAWFDATYGFKKKITILAAQVAGDETDYPVLISVTDANFKTTGNGGNVEHASGWDMIYTNSAEDTQLSHEIQRFVAASGEIIHWVKIPSLNSVVNTEIYVYYGKAGVGADPSTTATWNSSFEMVHHMHGANAAGSDDSTANGNDVTAELGDPTYQQTGKIGYAVDFDGTLDSLSIADDDTLSFGDGADDVAFSISTWIYMDDATNFILCGKGTTAAREYVMYIQAADKHLLTVNDNVGTAFLATTANNAYTGDQSSWIYVVGTYDGSSNVAGLNIYRNNAETLPVTDTSNAYTAMHNQTGIFRIGGTLSYDSVTNGKIDEFRVARAERGINWITTDYNNQNTPGDFVSWGNEEEICIDYTCGQFTITGDTYAVSLRKPIPSGETNKIVKNINRKAFWSGDYDVNDDGINSQPLILNGIEFTLCDLVDLVAKMTEILYMSNENEEVVITGLGGCMNGTYIIKSFRYSTIPKAIEAYAWTMVLEKVRN